MNKLVSKRLKIAAHWVGLIVIVFALIPTGFAAWMEFLATQPCPQGFWDCGESWTTPTVWAWWLIFMLNVAMVVALMLKSVRKQAA